MNRPGKHMAWILTPVLIVGLLGGLAWSQRSGGPGERGGERVGMARGEHGGFRGARHRKGGGHRSMKRMAEELGLNDEQVKAIRNVLIEARKKNIKLRADGRVARIELGQLITQGDVDKAAVNAKVDQIAGLRGDVLRQRAEAALAVRDILTPEQRTEADRIMMRLLHGRRGHRRG